MAKEKIAKGVESQLPHSRYTCRAFLWSSILKTPFWAIYGMLPFILYKDLGATPFQIAVLITLKPIVAVFSMYWSYGIQQRADRLRANVMWATVLGYLPFIFVPFIPSVWYLIAASGLFMLFNRGGIPAWMELLKRNVSSEKRKRVFAWGSTFCYLGGGGFPFLIGWLLDDFTQTWRYIFPATAFLGVASVLFQRQLQVSGLDEPSLNEESASSRPPIWHYFYQPWRQAWELLTRRPDFARFQWGFMFGGAGLMVMQPALPVFFVDTLGISYTELAIALTLCKGIGFALTSSSWAKWMHRSDIFSFSSYVTALAAFFPLMLMMVNVSMAYLYLAYIVYGVMQAGSELSWNLSGTIFAQKEDSSLFTGVNVVMVGFRGCIAPPLGSVFCGLLGADAVLLLGGMLCLSGTAALLHARKKSSVHHLI